MPDAVDLMHAKHAIGAFRQTLLSRLDELEALVDRALVADDPPPRPGIPQTRQGRRAHYKKHGVGSGRCHDASITGRLDK